MASTPEQRTGWRVIALVVLVIVVFALFRSIGITLFIIGSLFAFALLNFGFRGWGMVRTIGNIVLLLLILTSAYVTQSFPLFSRTLSGVPSQADIELTKKTMQPGVAQEQGRIGLAQSVDSINAAKLTAAWADLKAKIATEDLTPANQRIYDSLLEVERQSNENVRKMVLGQKLASPVEQESKSVEAIPDQQKVHAAKGATGDATQLPTSPVQPGAHIDTTPPTPVEPPDLLADQRYVEFHIDQQFITSVVHRFGGWEIGEDMLPNSTVGSVLTHMGNQKAGIFFGSPKWVNYTFEFDMKLLYAGGVDIYCRALDAANCYRLTYDNGCLNLVAYVRTGAPSEIGPWQGDPDCPQSGKWYHVKVLCQGDAIGFYRNGKLVREVQHGGFFRGLVGVGVNNEQTQVSFANFRVTKLP